jgi:O-antigen/teichoic acid export membrane protein
MRLALRSGPHCGCAFENRFVRPLLTTGGWLTVSNLLAPLMGYADRFIIATTISAGAVVYYAVPHEMITKLWIVPSALCTVLYPRFAAGLVVAAESVGPLMEQSLRGLFLAVYPLTLVTALFAHEILTFWLDPEFALQSAPLLQLFAVGLFANCLAFVPFTLLQSGNGARMTALINCAQLPVYVLLLWQATVHFGLIGTATVWLARLLVDTSLMFYFATRVVPGCSWGATGTRTLVPFVIAGLSFLGVFAEEGVLRGVLAAVVLASLLPALARPFSAMSRA